MTAARPSLARRRRLCHSCRLAAPVDESVPVADLQRTIAMLLYAFAPRLAGLRWPRRPNCWAWEAISTRLLDGPGTRNDIAEAVFGRSSDQHLHERNRESTYQMLRRLTRQGHLERLDHGWWALPGLVGEQVDRGRDDLERLLIAADARRPLTVADAAARLGTNLARVRIWMRDLGERHGRKLASVLTPGQGAPRAYWLDSR